MDYTAGALPRFSLDDATVNFLESPTDFFRALIQLYHSAKRRVVLASLYIGTGSLEEEIIDAIYTACLQAKAKVPVSFDKLRNSTRNSFASVNSDFCQKESASTQSSDLETDPENTQFTVDILIDALRGQRQDAQKKSSLTMLHPLLKFQQCQRAQAYRRLVKEMHRCRAKSKPHDKEAASCKCSNRASDPKSGVKDSLSQTLAADDAQCCETRDQTVLRTLKTTEEKIDQTLPVNIQIGAFHTPLLCGILSKVLPPRLNEIFGVFHTKMFLADDNVILSGANLSEAYLVNRQDRYVVIENARELTDFLQHLIQRFQHCSYDVSYDWRDASTYLVDLKNTAKIPWHPSDIPKLTLAKYCPCPIKAPQLFKQHMSSLLREALMNFQSTSVSHMSKHETFITVALQAGFALPPIRGEETLLTMLMPQFESLPSSSSGFSGWSTSVISFWAFCFYKCLYCIFSAVLTRILTVFTGDISQCARRPSRESSSENIFQLCEIRGDDIPLTGGPLPSLEDGDETRAPSSTMSNAKSCPNLSQKNRCYKHCSDSERPTQVVMSSGYLNMPRELVESLILCLSECNCAVTPRKPNASKLTIYVAAPEANSFYQSPGLSKYIPAAYSYICARQFKLLEKLWKQSNQLYNSAVSESFRMYQYQRSSWTYHSKGLWFYKMSEFSELPYATIIGSTNFGLRAKCRDCDLSFCIETRNQRLQVQLQREVVNMRKYSEPILDLRALKRSCPLWLKGLLRLTSIDSFF